MSAKIAHVRECFFTDGEKELLREMFQDSAEWEVHETLVRYDAEELCKQATKLIMNVEAGKYTDQQMPGIEKSIAHYLGAIENMERVREPERTIDPENMEERTI